jgi:acyl-CoA thioesterase
VTSFEEAAAVTRAGEKRWTAELAPDWTQGRTVFGGLQAALATTVAQEVAGPDRPLRTLDIGFVSPTSPGPVELDAEVLGSGRSATQLQVSLRQDGVLRCRVFAVAGAGRPSTMIVPGERPAGERERPEEQGVPFDYVEGLMPLFTQHVEMRWCTEAFPFGGAGPEGAVVHGWCRHRTPASGLEAVVGILDAWPPSVLPMAAGPTPASTVRWSVHLLEPVPPGEEKGWFWYEATTVHSSDGYATSRAGLWSGDRLVVWSEQLMTIYEKPPGQQPA